MTANYLVSKVQEEIKKREGLTTENAQEAIKEIVQDEKEKIGSKFLTQAASTERPNFKKLRYEALINKNQV